MTGSSRTSSVVLSAAVSSAGEGGGSAGKLCKAMNRSEVALRKALACAESGPLDAAGGGTPGSVIAKLALGGTSAIVCGVNPAIVSSVASFALCKSLFMTGKRAADAAATITTATAAAAAPPTAAITPITKTNRTNRANTIKNPYLASFCIHPGEILFASCSSDVIPSGGLGAGVTATSPEFTRPSKGARRCGEAPSRRRGRVTRRKVPESIRSGTRLERTVARIVLGLAINFACNGAVRVIMVSGCVG